MQLVSAQSNQCKFDIPKEDMTKTRNGLENGSIKLKICSPSGRGKSFHGRSLTSPLVTKTSVQVSPPAPPCAASKALQHR